MPDATACGFNASILSIASSQRADRPFQAGRPPDRVSRARLFGVAPPTSPCWLTKIKRSGRSCDLHAFCGATIRQLLFAAPGHAENGLPSRMLFGAGRGVTSRSTSCARLGPGTSDNFCNYPVPAQLPSIPRNSHPESAISSRPWSRATGENRLHRRSARTVRWASTNLGPAQHVLARRQKRNTAVSS